jgi:hypothetical protein
MERKRFTGHNYKEDYRKKTKVRRHRIYFERENRPTIELKTNQRVHEFTQVLSNLSINWDRVSSVFHERQLRLPRKDMVRNVVGTLLELHIATVLEDFALMNSDISVNPIPDGKEAGKYIFGYTGTGSLFARMKDNPGINVAEYDNFFLANGLPVIVESKGVAGGELGIDPITNLMRNGRIPRSFDPLTEIYRNQFGYILASTSESLRTEHPSVMRFTDLGGEIASFPFSKKQLFIEASNHIQYFKN